MSYGFYVYTDRASIETTQVYSQTSGKTYTYNYGTGQHSLNGFTDGDYLRFTAVPADGYEFKRWIYHIGSPTATTQYSTSNPFKYYGSTGNDIYIAAEGESTSGGGGSGGETDVEWTLEDFTPKTNTHTSSKRFSAGECYCFPITFSYSGKATFYCDSSSSSRDADMVAYLSRSTGFDTTSGKPTSILTSNDNSKKEYSDTMTSKDFGFEYNVVSEVTYYLFVRDSSIYNEPGLIYIHCIAPTQDVSYFEWSSGVAQGKAIKNVSHTEWDNFIDKIIEVLTDKGMLNQPLTSSKYGYATGTTYRTMLNDCYMTYDSTLDGYPLTAKKFNVARFIIGSFVSTGISDKTSRSSEVLASDFITLENCLKTIQDTI